MAPFDHSFFDETHIGFDSAIDSEFKYDSDDELAHKISDLAGKINAATYLFLKMLAEFDRRQGWKKHGVRSCSHWLNWKCSIGYCAAREKIRVAHALEKLPKINEAFEQGLVSYSKVRAMTRVATDENEAVLLNVADDFSASHVEKLVHKYQQVDADQKPLPELSEHESRELKFYQDEDGMWVITAKLPQVEGGLLIKAIEEVVRQQHKNDSAESFSQSRVDALCQIAEHYIATAKSDGGKALAGHERCQVVLHVSNNCQHIDGFRVSEKNMKRFSCDAQVLSVFENKYGEVLNLGRNSRTVSPSLKRVLDMRDQTCRFPGCCAKKHVEYHHVKHWSEGGETEPENLVKLCRFHHDMVHDNHFIIEWHEHDWLFKTMTGELIEASPAFAPVTSLDLHELSWPELRRKKKKTAPLDVNLDYSRALKDMLMHGSKQSLKHHVRHR